MEFDKQDLLTRREFLEFLASTAAVLPLIPTAETVSVSASAIANSSSIGIHVLDNDSYSLGHSSLVDVNGEPHLLTLQHVIAGLDESSSLGKIVIPNADGELIIEKDRFLTPNNVFQYGNDFPVFYPFKRKELEYLRTLNKAGIITNLNMVNNYPREGSTVGVIRPDTGKWTVYYRNSGYDPGIAKIFAVVTDGSAGAICQGRSGQGVVKASIIEKTDRRGTTIGRVIQPTPYVYGAVIGGNPDYEISDPLGTNTLCSQVIYIMKI